MNTKEAEAAYTIPQAAKLKQVSVNYIRAAIRRTDAHGLAAKKVGRGYRISASALEAWFENLPDA